jgi:hypothetical protein
MGVENESSLALRSASTHGNCGAPCGSFTREAAAGAEIAAGFSRQNLPYPSDAVPIAWRIAKPLPHRPHHL